MRMSLTDLSPCIISIYLMGRDPMRILEICLRIYPVTISLLRYLLFTVLTMALKRGRCINFKSSI